jgi:isopentenyl-diphosphate delta-isomerase
MERVILVDEEDNEIGTEEKMEAHRLGKLHRCFSIFIFNSKGEFLLVRRAKSKYHSGGLWTNTCCSHPRPGEDTATAAHRRLVEEVGFNTELHKAFTFTYRAKLDKGMTEHEFDHVFVGIFDGKAVPNPKEVDEISYVEPSALTEDMKERPERYTAWFKISLGRVLEWRKKEGA